MGYMLFLILLALSAFTKAQSKRGDILEETAPGYTIARYAEILNSSNCRRDLEEFREGVDRLKLWAIRLLDANGAPGSGFLYGNTEWIGRRKQCYDITNKKPILLGRQVLENFSSLHSPEEQYPPFETVYYSATVAQNTSLTYIIHYPIPNDILLGVCVPTSCTTDDVGIILKKIFRDRKLLAGEIYSMDFRLIRVKDVRDTSDLLQSGKILFILIILATLLAIAFISTLYDLIVYQKRRRAREMILTIDNNNTSELKPEIENDKNSLSLLQPESRMEQVIMCFSVYNNSRRLFDTSTNDKILSPLNGIKLFTMLWIISLHVGYYTGSTVDNEIIFIKESSYMEMQLICNGAYSVDTFFCMSGFLFIYVFLKYDKTKKSKICSIGESIKEFFDFLFKRFVRFTPTYMVIIGIAIVNFSWYDRISTFNMFEKISETCSDYWWANLLYINNLFPIEHMCLSWSWYLSSDMQFFIFGTVLALLSRKYYYPTMTIGACTIIASIIYSGYIVYVTNYIPRMDEQYLNSNFVYFPPWIRIPPYLIGMATAYFLDRSNNTLHLKKSTLIICWCVAFVNSFMILFATVNPYISLAESVIYMALSRTLWAIGTAWLIVACITNNAGIINNIFGAKLWIPFGRLTYCAYLLNPLIIYSLCLYNDGVEHVESLHLGAIFFGVSVAAYCSAYFVSVIVEMPFTSLFQLLIKSGTRRN